MAGGRSPARIAIPQIEIGSSECRMLCAFLGNHYQMTILRDSRCVHGIFVIYHGLKHAHNSSPRSNQGRKPNVRSWTLLRRPTIGFRVASIPYTAALPRLA